MSIYVTIEEVKECIEDYLDTIEKDHIVFLNDYDEPIAVCISIEEYRSLHAILSPVVEEDLHDEQ